VIFKASGKWYFRALKSIEIDDLSLVSIKLQSRLASHLLLKGLIGLPLFDV